MTAPTYSEPQPSLVQSMRKIRDQISSEIKDMTFEQERAYLDQLLSVKTNASDQPAIAKTKTENLAAADK